MKLEVAPEKTKKKKKKKKNLVVAPTLETPKTPQVIEKVEKIKNKIVEKTKKVKEEKSVEKVDQVVSKDEKSTMSSPAKVSPEKAKNRSPFNQVKRAKLPGKGPDQKKPVHKTATKRKRRAQNYRLARRAHFRCKSPRHYPDETRRDR